MKDKTGLEKEVLDEALKMLSRRPRNVHPQLKMVTHAGNEYPLSVTNQQHPLGFIVYHYAPGSLARAVLEHCERVIDARGYFRGQPADERAEIVKTLAVSITAVMLRDLPNRLTEAVELAYDEAVLAGVVFLDGRHAHVTGGVEDAREKAERLVAAWAGKQRKRLAAELKRAGRSEVVTPGDDSRLPKITEGRLKIAYSKAKKRAEPGERILQETVADRLGVDKRHLRRWCSQELKIKGWAEVVKYLERL